MASFCAGCGNSLTANDQFCRVCGKAVDASAPAAASAPAVPAETSGKAIASLICGLFFFLPPTAIAAIILGHLSLSQIRRSAGRLRGDGLAIAGLVLGYLGAGPILLILAAIAIPNLLRARMAANESSAVASMQTLNAAEAGYRQAHPRAGYTCSLFDLDPFLNHELSSGRKNGYVFELQGCSGATEGGVNVKYHVVAYPAAPNQTGVRAFCSDESAVIKVDNGGSARGCMENGSFLQ